METEPRTFSRSVFEKVAMQWLEILSRYGFTSQISTEPLFALIEGGVFEAWFGDVEPKQEAASLKVKLSLGKHELNKITLKCALVFVQATSWREEIHFEGFNAIRSTILALLEQMGYSVDGFDFLYIYWPCYRAWVDVATACGYCSERIAELRAEAREKFSEYYEE